MWSGCLLETLDEYLPGHGIERDQLRPFLRDGFPWHQPAIEHPEFCAPGAWWGRVQPLLATAYVGVGLDAELAGRLAGLARERYVDASCGWCLFDDVVPVRERLRADGWRHVVLSNHVPELPRLVCDLGISLLVDDVLTSAVTGYEKPHPRAFELALQRCSWPAQVWMVGDNPAADVVGAQAAGIPAIQVRSARGEVERYAQDLGAAAAIICGEISAWMRICAPGTVASEQV